MENKNAGGGFMKIANSLILGTLLVATGLLGWRNWKLSQQLASLTPSPAVPSPVPTAVAPPEKPSAFSPALAKKPSTTTKRNYTQPAKQLSSPTPAAPAAVARVTPTDVTPAEPAPFPRTESPVSTVPVKIRATIASGSILTVRLLDTLNTDRSQPGDRFRASLEEPILSDGNVVLPRGTTVEGRIVDAQQAGRVSGVAQLAVELTQVQLASGDMIVIETDTVRRQGETSTGSDTAKVGAGAAIGAVIGAIGGGGKGAAIGAATGAGAGTAGVLLTRGKPLILSQETILSFQLNSPVAMEVFPGQAPDVGYSQPQRTAPSPRDLNRDRPILRRRLG